MLLVRQLLLPLLNHLWHFGHPWGKETLYCSAKVSGYQTQTKQRVWAAANGSDLGFSITILTTLEQSEAKGVLQRIHRLSSSNTSKQIHYFMNDQSRTMTASVKCEKTLASDFYQLIMPSCTDNTIDLLPLMINSLLMVPLSASENTLIFNHSISVSEERSFNLVFHPERWIF